MTAVSETPTRSAYSSNWALNSGLKTITLDEVLPNRFVAALPRRVHRRTEDNPVSFVDPELSRIIADAACRGLDPQDFVPEGKGGSQYSPLVTRICKRCPVREACLQFAIEHQEHGYWGGTTEQQRRAM